MHKTGAEFNSIDRCWEIRMIYATVDVDTAFEVEMQLFALPLS